MVSTFAGTHPGGNSSHLNRVEANEVVIERISASMLALINLDEAIDMKDKSLANSVCLPEAYITNNRTEYALMTGWGLADDKVDLEGRPKFVNPGATPRVGWTIIMEDSFSPESGEIEGGGLIYAMAPSGGARDCKVSIEGF